MAAATPIQLTGISKSAGRRYYPRYWRIDLQQLPNGTKNDIRCLRNKLFGSMQSFQRINGAICVKLALSAARRTRPLSTTKFLDRQAIRQELHQSRG
ncbi:hypothetical protein FoTM2_004798 [Fusarium oxysporum f. sp. vasinfectum]|nr:hypothetical protein FoTM2_004798 [Fusarium oxysporum f. sp. vasinfectum]